VARTTASTKPVVQKKNILPKPFVLVMVCGGMIVALLLAALVLSVVDSSPNSQSQQDHGSSGEVDPAAKHLLRGNGHNWVAAPQKHKAALCVFLADMARRKKATDWKEKDAHYFYEFLDAFYSRGHLEQPISDTAAVALVWKLE